MIKIVINHDFFMNMILLVETTLEGMGTNNGSDH